MKSIFVTGTAGAGKSLLSSRLHEYYTRNGAFAAVLNLDPGVESMPYTCDVDARDYVDIASIMQRYDLGPNGALVMASDLLASKVDEIRREVDRVNPDYLIVDTPGQIELAAYRWSGPFLMQNISQMEKVSIFLLDGSLVAQPANFVSIALLATSVRLRLGLPAVNVMTKTDIIHDDIGKILEWASSPRSLEDALSQESDGDMYAMTTGIMRGLETDGLVQDLIPVSNVTGEGLVTLEGSLSRIINRGEEVED